MLYTYPHYYKKFHCTASECEDTCCAGWEIMIDKKSLEKYKKAEKAEGAFGNRLHNSINWKEGSFSQYHHRCALLNDENLCDLYTEMGPDSLCKTCRTYPRHIEEFDGVREYSLCMSCMEAAKIVLGTKETVRFLSKEDEREENEDAYEDFDFFLYTKLTDARERLLEILQDRTLRAPVRMKLGLALAHDLQRRIRDGKLYEVDAVLERFGKSDRAGILQKSFEKKRTSKKTGFEKTDGASRYELMLALYEELENLEPLHHHWPEHRTKMKETLYENGKSAYERQRKEFLASAAGERMELFLEQLMVYFVFTYFCGAVYNENAYGKYKFSLACTMLLEDMAQAVWAQREKYRADRSSDAAEPEKAETADSVENWLIDLVHRFCREVEHSEENLNALEDVMTKNAEFGIMSWMEALEEE
ncbi:flagellin lysine-N-methylase [Brotaphodocola sp.]|uniref:flagellin lysine-N-methylase n=1 Tax=Brotaphodocola sp. TaxID=3073577 RepID=UPI003D7E5338